MIEKELNDYEINKNEIDKWLHLKGETKFLELLQILKNNNLDLNWNNLSALARYDKRLLVNIFKYLSFLEDAVRALLLNNSKKSYIKVEKLSLRELTEEVLKLKLDNSEVLLDIEKLEFHFSQINELRNRVSHNKIILNYNKEGVNLEGCLEMLKEVLPATYQSGFTNDINNCTKKINDSDKNINLNKIFVNVR